MSSGEGVAWRACPPLAGTREEAEAFLAVGLHIRVTGWICDDRERKVAPSSETLRAVPRGRLMVETDAPYLTPRTIEPNRLRPWRNEPCLLPVCAERRVRRGIRGGPLLAHLRTTGSSYGHRGPP